MTDALSDRYPTRRLGAIGAIGVTLAILGVGFVILGLSPALFAALYLGMAAVYVAVPYTAIAIIAREVNAWRGRRHGEGEGGAGYRDEAVQFGMFRQRASMVTAIVMLAALLAWRLSIMTWDARTGTPLGPEHGTSIMLFGAFAVLAGGLSIVVNAPSIYAGSVVRSERYAIRERVGAWRLILANTILTTLSWIGYCAFAVYFLVEEM